MIPRNISNSNVTYGAPVNWNEKENGKCLDLKVRIDYKQGFVESAWEPTPEELKLLNQGGSVILRIYGSQPPVWLTVEESVKDD